jgi:hypothetical protein
MPHESTVGHDDTLGPEFPLAMAPRSRQKSNTNVSGLVETETETETETEEASSSRRHPLIRSDSLVMTVVVVVTGYTQFVHVILLTRSDILVTLLMQSVWVL